MTETTFPPDPDGYPDDALNRARDLLNTVPGHVGRYRVLERIGGGGMGEVYVAEQTEPIKRRVALKLIKAGMDTRQVIARFEAERQALAMMDHPNVARVYDAGTTDAGRPYFVMELIRGVPITQFCDDNKLTTRQRVELLVPVCQAVQHAHQKGIIHRDLKPTNVLVTLHDGKPVPKVIDFGIAKATGPSLTDKTVYTEFRQMVGTPAYMSPEQAEMSGLDIDTRSDVYSLGVLAYELLTGSTPFDTQRLVKAGLAEIGRIIKEEDPPTPSRRLSTLGERLTTVAGQRGTDAARIGRLVAGELDWIVMRAMEKDRARRYETANGLAADLQRYLAGEPVQAAPPSLGYKLRKIARRHKAQLLTAAALAGLLVFGTIVSTTQAIRARRAETAASAERDEATRQTQLAQQQRDAADAAKRRAADSEGRAVEQATTATQLSHYVTSQYLLSQGRVGPALREVQAAIAIRPRLEYGYLQANILDAARSHWLPVTKFDRTVVSKAVGCFAGKGGRVLAVGDGDRLTLVATETGKVLHERKTPGRIERVVACGDRVVVAGPNGLASYPIDGNGAAATKPLDEPVRFLAGDSAGRQVVACLREGMVLVLDANTMAVTHRRQLPFHVATSATQAGFVGAQGAPQVDFSPSGTRVLFHSGFWNEPAYVWHLSTDQVNPQKLERPQSARFLDEDTIVNSTRQNSSANDMTIARRDLKTGAESVHKYASRGKNGFTVWPAGTTAGQEQPRPLAAATSDDAIDVYDLEDYSVVTSDRFASLLPQYAADPRFLAYNGPSGLLAVTTDRDVWVFQSTAFGPGVGRDNTPSYRDTSFWSLATSDTSIFTALYHSSGLTVHRTDWKDGRSESFDCVLPPTDDGKGWKAWGMAVTPDGGTLAVLMQECTGGGTINSDFFRKIVLVFDPRQPERPLRPLKTLTLTDYYGLNGREIGLLILSPDGKTVTVRAASKASTLYRIEDGAAVATFKSGFGFCASPDGSLLAVSEARSIAKVLSSTDGRSIFSVKLNSPIQTMAFTRDNRHLYVGRSDNVVDCYDIASGRLLHSLPSPVMPTAVSPDGTRVVGFIPATAGSANGSMVIGDLTTGRPVVVINEGAHVLNRAYLNPAGNAFAYIQSRMVVDVVPEATTDYVTKRLAQTYDLIGPG